MARGRGEDRDEHKASGLRQGRRHAGGQRDDETMRAARGPALALMAIVGCRFVFGRRSFAPDKVAQAEARICQAYSSGNRTQTGLG